MESVHRLELQVVETINVRDIPPQTRQGLKGWKPQWPAIFRQLEKMPVNKALVIKHNAGSSSELGGKLHTAALRQRIKIKGYVRGDLVYVHRIG